MSKLRPVSLADHAQEVDERDLEAVTAHRIRLLVARANAWRGNARSSAQADIGDAVESAAS